MTRRSSRAPMRPTPRAPRPSPPEPFPSQAQTETIMPRSPLKPALLALALFALPTAAQACACGCAVFDVGTASLLPSGPGGSVFLEYDFLNQTTNWSGGHAAPGAGNDEKKSERIFLSRAASTCSTTTGA